MKKILIALVVLVLVSSFAMAKTPVLDPIGVGDSAVGAGSEVKATIGGGTGVYYGDAISKAIVDPIPVGNRIIDQMSFESAGLL